MVIYTGLLLIAALVSAWLALYTWRRRGVAGARNFAMAMAAVAGWALIGAATHLSPTLAGKVVWTNLQYPFIALVPVTWLLFALAYTGRGHLVRPSLLAALAVHPLLLQIVVWTNPAGLFRTRVWLDTTGPIPTMGNELGAAFWIHTAYSYALLLYASFLLVRAHWSRSPIYRRQGMALVIAIAAPWISNIVTIFGASWLAYLDLTPFAFMVSGVAIAWGLLREGLLDLVPVACSAVIHSLPTGIIVLDPQERVADLNPAAAEILGVGRGSAAGRPLRELVPHYAYLLARQRDASGEAHDEWVLGEGEARRVYDLRSSTLPGSDGRLVGHLISLQDITERKASQTTLSRYADRLRILHQIDQAILSAQSPRTIALAVLEQIHRLVPAQRMSVVVCNDPDRVTQLLAIRVSERLRECRTPWEQAVGEGLFDHHQVVVENQVSDGESSAWLSRELYHAGVRAYLVVPLMVQETMVGTLNLESTAPAVFTDEHADMATQVATSLAVALESARLYAAAQQEIADRRQAEAALRESEASLRQKAEDLAARNAELDAFAHTVAHDLKTPLSLLTGYATFIAAGEVADNPEQLDWCVRAIGQSARKMHNIIDELLLLSSVRKMDEVALQPLDMGAIVDDVLIRLSDLVAQEHAEVIVPDIWPIAWGYAPWIEEVWANYISNALKYGGVPPRIELGATVMSEGDPDADDQIRFWVHDNGGGLTEAQRARLFIPFERLDQARAKGYGLGLSIVQRIMEKLNGTAGVTSAGVAGEGSTFYFDLPYADLS